MSHQVPTETGLYWVRLSSSSRFGTEQEWTVVRFDNGQFGSSCQKAPPGFTWVESIGWDAGALVPDDCWGPMLEPPATPGLTG